jgi:DNA-binding PadR family transcriptional regulator
MKPSARDITLIEQHTMLAMLRLHPNGYGVTIRDEINRRTERSYSIGSVYTALERLQTAGLVEAREGEPTAERGGRRKTYFTLTATGHRALEGSLHAIDAMRRGLAGKEVEA